MVYRRWFARILVVFGTLSLISLYLFPVAFQGKIPADRDNVCFYYPLLTVFQWDGVPLWNPYELSGSSLVANPQVALFYPLNWVLPFLARNLGFSLTTLAHYIWAALGAYLLARRLKLGREAAFMAAVTFMLGGYLQSRLLLRPLLLSAAWMPWALALYLRAVETEKVLECILAGIAAAMTFLPGMYHNGVYTLGFFVLATVFVPVPRTRGKVNVILHRAGLFVLAAGLGVGFAAVSIVPVAELLPYTVRSDFDYEAASASSVAISDLPRAFCGFPRTPGLEEWNFFEKNAFPGWIGLVLAVVSLHRVARRKGLLPRGSKRAVVLFVTAFTGGLLVALGRHTPIHGFLFHLPGGRFLNNPSRALVLCSLSFSLLAAIGLEECDQILCQWRRPRLIVVYGFLMAQIAGLFWYRGVLNVTYAYPPYQSKAPHVEFLTKSREEGVRVMTYDALRRVSGDFWPFHWPRFRNMLVPKIAAIDRVEDIAGYDPLYIKRYGEVVRALSGQGPGAFVWRDVLPGTPNPRLLNLLSVGYVLGEVHDRQVHSNKVLLTGIDEKGFAVDSGVGPCCAVRIQAALRGSLYVPQGTKVGTFWVRGRNPDDDRAAIAVPLRAGVEVSDMLAGSFSRCAHRQIEVYRRQVAQTDHGPVTVQTYDARIPLPETVIPEGVHIQHFNSEGGLDVLSVVFERRVEDSPFELAFEKGTTRIYRNRDALPRAWLVFEVEEAAWPEGILARLKSPRWDPRRSVLVEEATPVADVSGGEGTLSWKHRRRDEMELEVEASRTGVLVLSEVYYPGWKARIDGGRARILRVNGFLRGVVVPPGVHQVRLAYSPDGLLIGLGVVVGCVGILVALTVVLWWLRQRELATLSPGRREEMGKNVLVVEDESDTRTVLEESLRYYGFEVVSAKDGMEALEILEKSHPDLILLDMQLPVLSGWEALQMIKADQRLKEIPVIVLTASTSVSDESRALSLGCADFIAKPCEPKEVVARIERALERQRRI